MVYSATKTVAAAGTRGTLTSTRTAATWVLIQAHKANTGSIYVGDSTVTSSNGIELLGGDSVLLPDTTAPSPYDLVNIYIDASVNGEGVRILYMRR